MSMGVLATWIVSGALASEGDEALPRTIDLRPGYRRDIRVIDARYVQIDPFFGGDFTYRKPGGLYVRAGLWAGKRNVYSEGLASEALAEVFRQNDVSVDTAFWTDFLGVGEVAWETPSFGPKVYLRAGASGVYSRDGLADFVGTQERLYDQIAFAAPDQLTAGPMAAIGGDYRIGELRLEPQLSMAYRFPVASSTTWRDEWLAVDLAENGLRLPLGFVSPVGTVEGRLGIARDRGTLELGYRISQVGVSRYDAMLNTEERGPSDQIQPSIYESVEVRVGLRFGKAQDSAAASDEPPEGIQHIGVPDLDALFEKVEAIRKERERLHKALVRARRSLEALASHLGAGSAADLLAGLRSGGIKLGVQITLEGGRPKVTPSATLQGEAAAVAKAIEDLLDATKKIQQSVPALVKKAKELVAQAQETVKAGPSMLKKAGIPPMEVPNALKALKGNVQVTAALPAELQSTLTEALGIAQMFTGGGGDE